MFCVPTKRYWKSGGTSRGITIQRSVLKRNTSVSHERIRESWSIRLFSISSRFLLRRQAAFLPPVLRPILFRFHLRLSYRLSSVWTFLRARARQFSSVLLLRCLRHLPQLGKHSQGGTTRGQAQEQSLARADPRSFKGNVFSMLH